MTGGNGGAGGSDAASGGDSAGTTDAAGSTTGSSGICGPPATNLEMDGPFTPTHITNGGPSGSSWVFFPMELGMNGMVHPVFNWGPGAGTGPDSYLDHLNRVSSYGFVVISQTSSGDGSAEKAALDWMLAQNDMSGSMFYHKLDPTRVGAGGHSLGALTTFAMAADPRLTLYVFVCGGSGSGTTGAANVHGPAVFLGGDSDPGTPNFDPDYAAVPTAAAFVIKTGTDHIYCARNNLAPWVGFMRWQWCGETQWKPDFLTGGTWCTDPWQTSCQSKGF
jgi:hypothetical protein